MNIKIITCHEVYNAGASLQAYAFETYLEQLGHEVEFIDYKPKYLQHYKLFGIDNPRFDKPVIRELYNILKFPGRYLVKHSRKKKKYDLFTKNYLSLTSRRYSSFDELMAEPPSADVFFAGSDQIWNTFFPNGRDPAFFLAFIQDGSVKASYAASFATQSLPVEWTKTIREWLKALDYISVRESSGCEIVKQLGIEKVVNVLDPVFLLSAEHWERLEQSLEIPGSYLLVYDFDHNPDIELFAKKLAKQKRWKIVTLFKSDYSDYNCHDVGPEEFVFLIRHAEFVISNSFHASAFSIIFQKQFVVFERKESINTRLHDLLDLCGISNVMLTDEREYEDFLIDYAEVNEKINVARVKSKRYIDEVLEAVK